MQLPFLLSTLFHIVLLLFIFFGMDVAYDTPIVEDNTMVVEFAQIASKTAAPTQSALPDVEKKQKKTPQKSKKEPAEQKEKAHDSTQDKSSGKSTEKKKDLPSKNDDINLTKTDKNKKKKKQDDKKTTEKKSSKRRAQMNIDSKHDKNKTGKKNNLDDMLDDLMDDQATDDKTSAASATDAAESFTTSEISVLRAHISRCWNVHSGAKGAQNHIVDVEIHLSQDGHVQSAQIIDKARMKRDPFYRVAAETAQRSLLDDDCNPLPIPASAYDKWKVITFRFDPKDMF